MNILYIEDLESASIKNQLQDSEFNITQMKPDKLEDILDYISNNKIDLLILDFKLTTNSNAVFDAPTIAQTLRTKNTVHHKDIPIVLISTDQNFTDYYNDYSSHDLFDFACTKEKLLDDPISFKSKLESFLKAYELVKANSCDVEGSLNKSKENFDILITEKLRDHIRKDDYFAFITFIYNHIINSIGVLIGEDVLSARLGVSKESEDWTKLKEQLIDFKYKGIFSDYYDRWWSKEIESWWSKNNEGKNTLRREVSELRVEKIANITKLKNLKKIEKLGFSQSNRFWTICRKSKSPIDPIDGLELNDRELYAWQEKEYLSVDSALETPSEINNIITASDKIRLKEIREKLV